jgi:sugar phosphate permease
MSRKSKFFYGWVIVAVAGVGMMLVYGIRQSFSVFFPPILEEFAWSRGSTALMLSLNLLFYGFTAPLVGNLADRWDPRRVVLIGASVLILSTGLCAFADHLWHFYLLFGVIVPMGSACCGWPLVSPTLANWFLKRRGFAMAVGQVGGGLSFTFSLFAEYTINQLGWRYSYFVLAGTIAFLLLPLYLLFFYYRPQNRGLVAYGASEPQTIKPGDVSHLGSQEWTFRKAIRSPRLWLLVATHSLFWGVGCYLVLGHQIQFSADAGYSTTFAASIFALFGVFMVVGQLAGAVSDWIGREKTVTIAVLLTIGAMVALLAVTDTSKPALLYVFAICFGLGAGVFGPAMFAGAADIFYGKDFGAINGLILTGLGIGGVFGPWLGGYLYDVRGNYTSAFLLCIGCFVLACITFWIAGPRHETRKSKIK